MRTKRDKEEGKGVDRRGQRSRRGVGRWRGERTGGGESRREGTEVVGERGRVGK